MSGTDYNVALSIFMAPYIIAGRVLTECGQSILIFYRGAEQLPPDQIQASFALYRRTCYCLGNSDDIDRGSSELRWTHRSKIHVGFTRVSQVRVEMF